MTPKRLRLIARIIKQGTQADSATSRALADELEHHADQYEELLTKLATATEKPVRLREPGTVFGDLERAYPKAQEGRR